MSKNSESMYVSMSLRFHVRIRTGMAEEHQFIIPEKPMITASFKKRFPTLQSSDKQFNTNLHYYPLKVPLSKIRDALFGRALRAMVSVVSAIKYEVHRRRL